MPDELHLRLQNLIVSTLKLSDVQPADIPDDEALIGSPRLGLDSIDALELVLAIEKVMSWFGKTLSMAIREKIQLAGLAVILLLMVFTLFLDISRFF